MAEPNAQGRGKYADLLWDGFDVVAKHIEDGIVSAKELANFVKRRAAIESEYGRSLGKLCRGARELFAPTQAKRGLFGKSPLDTANAMGHTVSDAWLSLLVSTEAAAEQHAHLGEQLTSSLADPLFSAVRDLEMKRKQAVDEATKHIKELTDAYSALRKAKAAYIKHSKEAAEAFGLTPEGKPKKATVKEKSLKVSEKAQAAETEYSTLVAVTNEMQTRFYAEHLPVAMESLQKCDDSRMNSSVTMIKEYLKLEDELPGLLHASFETLHERIEAVSVARDIAEFAQAVSSGRPRPSAIEMVSFTAGVDITVDDIPVAPPTSPPVQPQTQTAATSESETATPEEANSPLAPDNTTESTDSPKVKRSYSAFARIGEAYKQLRRPKGKKGSERDDMKDGIFGLPLEIILERELRWEQPSEDDVPKVLHLLTNALFKRRGAQTVGIFRIPADHAAVQTLKAELNAGHYSAIEYVLDPHVVAATIKGLLREMSPNIIPPEMYDECIAAAESKEAALAIFDKLPAANRAVLRHMLQLILTVADPVNVAVTKMDVRNLSLIMAPCFLQSNSTDPAKMMVLVDTEQQFVMTLIAALESNASIQRGAGGRAKLHVEEDDAEARKRSPSLGRKASLASLGPVALADANASESTNTATTPMTPVEPAKDPEDVPAAQPVAQDLQSS